MTRTSRLFSSLLFMTLVLLPLTCGALEEEPEDHLVAGCVPAEDKGNDAAPVLKGSDARSDRAAQRAERSFRAFCNRWISARNSKAEKNVRCRKLTGGVIAEYTLCNTMYDAQVKKAAGTDTFIGLLKYNEQTYRSYADSVERAAGGSFELAQVYPVTEIFMYADGEWQY